MPLYEYRCTACGYKFEKIQKFSEEPLSVCPKCEGQLVRPMTAPALRFEGAGWYVNDYAGKGAASPSDAPATGPETAAKDAKTESKPADTAQAPSAAAPAAAPPSASSSTTAD